MLKLSRKQKIVLGLVAVAGFAAPVFATHSWNGYHWVRTTAELTLPVGDNVDGTWDSYLVTANADWNKSTVINSPLVAGSTTPRKCAAVAGTIQVCNAAYGRTGWLGIASISIVGGHISQGTTKVNDTYFTMAQYNNPSERALVMCQEIGHDYGLDHQDTNFATDNTNSCMDYTNLPAGNEHPDAHDYQELTIIYNHLESVFAIGGGRGSSGMVVGDSPADWGRPVHFLSDGRADTFERIDGPGQKTVTHVFWADEGGRGIGRS